MKPLTLLAISVLLAVQANSAPLRVFIRGGEKSHGPNAHEHERFLNDWKPLLTQRGIQAEGAKDWPTQEQFRHTDVLVMYAQDGGNATPEQKANVAEFTQRGGGIVVIHTAAVSNDPAWWKSVIGGAWIDGKTKWKEGPMDLYYVENQRPADPHPITIGASNFHINDEVYYDMDLSPDIRVLATSYTPNVPGAKKSRSNGQATVYDIQPQMWAYEKANYRAFVTLPGHLYSTFNQPHYRAILLRGIAWTAKRSDIDEFCTPEEISSLTYPEGGPQRPADTLKALEIHPDFNMKLVTSEPLITKPMNFDWDPSGRMWVAETPEYPNGRRGMRPDYRGKEWKDHGGIDPEPGLQTRKAIDKISILTDTDGDGVMDKKQIFYEGLELVTGLVFHKDGVIVTQAPDILWLRDTDHDNKADKVEKLYTGLGTSDTHAVINNPRWGWDGWIYCTHGYSSGNVKSGDGTKDFGNIGSGVVRFKPDGSAFEQYSSKGGNTWGLEITGDNRVMWTQPTSGELLMQTLLPEYALARGKFNDTASFNVIEQSGKTFPALAWDQIAYRQIDWVGSFTAAAGCVVYDGGTWPKEYDGDYFTTEPTINIVHHTRLTPQGSSATFHKLPGREETEFIRSKDMWWRPIEVRVGPDGAIYVGDFYNQAVIHNDTRGPDHNRVNAAVRPDRDHYFGRIWRVDHKNAKKLVVPDLSNAPVSELVKAIESPNRVIRMTASRLLLERPNPLPAHQGLWRTGEQEKQAELMEKNFGYRSLLKLALDSSKPTEPRIAALWVLGLRDAESLMLQWTPLIEDKDPAIRRNAALVAELPHHSNAQSPQGTHNVVTNEASFLKLLDDKEAPVRLAALRALATSTLSKDGAKALVAAWPTLNDDFQRSAAIGAATQGPATAIAAALDSPTPAPLTPFVNALAPYLTEPEDAALLVISLAAKPASIDPLKQGILKALGKSLKTPPRMTPELKSAIGHLLAGNTSASILPLALKWDAESGDFAGTFSGITEACKKQLTDPKATDTVRISAARTLIDLRSTGDWILPAISSALTEGSSPALQREIVNALGATGDPKVGGILSASFPKLPRDVQANTFEILLQRSEWALALIETAKARKADISTLGPANLARLRTYPDALVSKAANTTLDEIMGPALQAKAETLAKLTAIVEKPGDAAKGKILFTAACAVCHKLNDAGADIGPGLTGIGAHGPSELLTSIIDPNREVDPSYIAWNIETKDGKYHSGAIARENPTSLILRSLAGQEEINIADIKNRVNTGRSLMPEGFESLGGETLRDILSYICGTDAQKFRMVDLRTAFTADTRKGLYKSQAATGDTLNFKKFGNVEVGNIPFSIIDPAKSSNGNNVVVLKGGLRQSFSNTLPQRVEAKLGGFKANRLHFLGGVTGWGYQGQGDPSPVMKAIVFYSDGQSEEMIFQNGIEFSDYGWEIDVPGSSPTKLVRGHQLRFFSKSLKRTAAIERITLESFASDAAPTTVAITAELTDAASPPNENTGLSRNATQPISKPLKKNKAALPEFKAQFNDPVPIPPAQAQGPRVLLVGGGSSHDFVRFFGATDKATLSPVVGWVEFTQNLNGIAPILKDIDVVVMSANQPISPASQQALLAFADSGKGIIALHPGTWYAWENFPQWNEEIVCGGTRGHDALGTYTVKVIQPSHPVTKGVSASFEITDELYNHQTNLKGTSVEVLAQSISGKTGKTFPQVFVVKHPKARIVGITLGHDERAHDLSDYKTLLKNAVKWVSEK